MSIRSHYERLGLPEDASAQAIHAAWQIALRRQTPQSVAQGESIAQAAAVADAQLAHSVLSDSQRRAQYDRQLAARRRVQAVPGGTTSRSANDAGWATQASGAATVGIAPRSRLYSARRGGSTLRTHRGRRRFDRLWPLLTVVFAVLAALGWGRALTGTPAADAEAARPLPAVAGAAASLTPELQAAHAQWLRTAAQTQPHPLDGEPLPLHR